MKALITFIFTFLLTIIVNFGFSQFFKAGIILGVNGSQITGDNMLGFNKGGINSGLFIEHQLIKNENLSLRFEINYTQKGSRRLLDPYTITPGIWDLYRADYIEIPFMLDYIIYKQYGITAGLASAFNVNEKYIPRDGSDFEDFNLAKKFETSLLIGLTFHFSEKLVFFGRYQSSIYNFSTASNTPIWQIWGDVRKGYIHVLTSAGLRYYFNLK